MIDLHHTHLFASDINTTVAWWTQHLNAKVLFDETLAGARNVFLAIGTGRLHIYDQPPRNSERGAIHHLGVRVANLKTLWQRLQAEGISSPNGLRDFGDWRYVMIAAPDDILVELFEFDNPTAAANFNGRP